jgi:hypothetical protein
MLDSPPYQDDHAGELHIPITEQLRAAEGALRVACSLLTECEAIIGTVDPECTSEAEAISKLRAQIVDFLAGDADNGEFGLTG